MTFRLVTSEEHEVKDSRRSRMYQRLSCFRMSRSCFGIGGFHVTSSPPCWWTVNKRSLISSLCLSTSICSFHHCYLCLPRLHENHLLVRDIFKLLFIILARNIDCKSTLQKTLKQLGLVASKYERKSRYKSNFQCVSLRRRVCVCPVMSRDMFLQSAFQFGFLPSKPSFYPEN